MDGVWGREGFEISELIECADDQLWFGENRDRIRLEAGPGSVRVLGWPSKMRAGKGSFLGGKLNLALKKISAGRRRVRAMRAIPFSASDWIEAYKKSAGSRPSLVRIQPWPNLISQPLLSHHSRSANIE
jgi:hypothetical protein